MTSLSDREKYIQSLNHKQKQKTKQKNIDVNIPSNVL